MDLPERLINTDCKHCKHVNNEPPIKQFLYAMHTILKYLINTASYRIWLLRQLIAKCNSFLQTIPPSLKTNCPQKRKPVLSRVIWGRSLQTFCPQASYVSCWWCMSKTRWVWFIHLFVLTELSKNFFWTLEVKKTNNDLKLNY